MQLIFGEPLTDNRYNVDMGKEKQPAELYDFDAPFVSFVPKGANKKKRFFLLKSDGGNNMAEIDNELLVELQEIFKAELPEDAQKALKEIEKQKLSEKAMNAVKGAMKLLNAYKEEIGADVLKKLAAKAGYGFAAPKQEEPPKKKPEEEKYPAEKVKKTVLEAIEDKELKTKVEKAFEEAETGKVQVEDPRVVALMKEHNETKVELAKEKDIRVTKEFEEKADEFKNLNTKKEELGSILKNADEHFSDEDKKKLSEVLKAADKQIAEGNLLKEAGSSRVGMGGDAWTKIEKAAVELIKEDAKLTKEAAIAKACEQNPELYNEYEKDRRVN